MLALKRPYFSPHMRELMEKILKEEFAPPPPHYSEDMIDLCHFILRKDPGLRPTVRQIFQVKYIQKGLQQLVDIVRRNTLVDASVKSCLVDHVDEVLTEASKQTPASSTKLEGEVKRATGTLRSRWETCWLQLDEQKLAVYKARGDKEPTDVFRAEDISNACPIGPQECGSENPFVFATFLTHKPHTVWFRCESNKDVCQWLDRILTVIGI
eukprot:TRINITY_DN20940_c0_g1_i2.p1 TRINITY_DN20940_c0_g1~~TRINITY_DN20940_c0_g1_i2.p1  ORF type:complete len:211 (+),score=30.08 TRINITY_DN20940_c0_g1_i2:259-891(+)